MSIANRFGSEIFTAKTGQEILEQGGLDWTVRLETCERVSPSGNVVASCKAVVREDMNTELGIVGKRYAVYQNDSVTELIAPLIEAEVLAALRAGAFDLGQRIFVSCKSTIAGQVNGTEVNMQVVFSSAHDGSGSVSLQVMPVRSDGTCLPVLSVYKFRHTGNVAGRVKTIFEKLDLSTGQFLATMKQYEDMARMGMDSADFRRCVKVIFDIKDKDDNDEAEADSRLLAKVLEHGGKVSNAWEALNAIADYLNSEKAGRSTESALESLWFGPNKERALKAMKVLSEGSVGAKPATKSYFDVLAEQAGVKVDNLPSTTEGDDDDERYGNI